MSVKDYEANAPYDLGVLPGAGLAEQAKSRINRLGHALGSLAYNHRLYRTINAGLLAAGIGVLSYKIPSFNVAENLIKVDAITLAENINLLPRPPEVDIREATITEGKQYFKTFALGNGIYRVSKKILAGPAPIWDETAKDRMNQDGGDNKVFVQGLMSDLKYYSDGHGIYGPNVSCFPEFDGPLNDDRAWLARELVIAYKRTGKPLFLQKAAEIIKAEFNQWEDQGGIPWMIKQPDMSNHQRAVVSNATVAEVAAEMSVITKGTKYYDPAYLQQAKKIYDWTYDTFFNPKTGEFSDHISKDGSIDETVWTYVQGIMVGAMVTLHNADPANPQYNLQKATAMTERSMDYAEAHQLYGYAVFDSIFFQEAVKLAQQLKSKEFADRVNESLSVAISRLPKQPILMRNAAGALDLLELQKNLRPLLSDDAAAQHSFAVIQHSGLAAGEPALFIFKS